MRLEYIEPYQLGTKVFLRFVCKTGDAMGMNGVTKASADMIRALLAKLPGWRLVTISGNLCTDKKAAHINVLKGRGKSVHTEIHISEEVLKAVFKQGVTARKVQQVVFHKCYLGSGFAGTVSGFNVNAANTIAAFFAATGQDLAQVITSGQRVDPGRCHRRRASLHGEPAFARAGHDRRRGQLSARPGRCWR